jgi:hypothetical protein
MGASCTWRIYFCGAVIRNRSLGYGLFCSIIPNMVLFLVGCNIVFVLWVCCWYAVLGIVGLHKIRFFAMIPTILLSNTTLSLCLVGLWRLSYEHGVFAYLLLFSHLMNVFFSFIYSKESLTRNFKKTSDLGRTVMKIVMFLPLT